MTDGEQRGLRPVGYSKLREYSTDVRLDGLLRHMQQPCYLAVGVAGSEQFENVPFPSGQRADAAGIACRTGRNQAGCFWGEHGMAIVHRANSPDQRIGIHIFVQKAGRARLQRQPWSGRADRAGQDKHAGAALLCAQL